MTAEIRRPADETRRPLTQHTTTLSSATDRIVQALQAHGSTVKQTGANIYQAQCPAHDDHTPSLTITQIKGQALLHCHRGCPNEDVVAAVNLRMADLYDNPKGAAYEYRDPDGRLARTVYRSPDKKFTQNITIKNNNPLYNLAAVTEAVKAGEPVLIVEGEKDVHAAGSQGLTATTSPGGAANWAGTDYGPLRGAAHVIIVADRDEAGYKCAAGRRRHLLNELGIQRVDVVAAATGKDLADHIAAGHGVDELVPVSPEDLDEAFAPAVADPPHGRELILTAAADIKPRRVRWLWDGRIALGTLALLAGLQGLGKSTLAYWIAAQITLGTLPGEFRGVPRSVLVCATEDSWEHTIVPRLIAAGADLTRVLRVEVRTADDILVGLLLPSDNRAVEEAARMNDAALLINDPIISRFGNLDTHKDADVRQGLEPLVAVAARAHMAVFGLIHHNKSGSADPLASVMGSTAFSAVARSVHTVVPDPDDDTGLLRLFGTPKNNLGRTDLPTLAFTVESHAVETDEGTAWTGRIDWRGEHEGSIADAMLQSQEAGVDRSATKEAADWLRDYVTSQGGSAASADIKREGTKEGHSYDALKRARKRLHLEYMNTDTFPKHSIWFFPGESAGGAQSGQLPWGESLTALTTPTREQSVQSGQSGQSDRDREDPHSLPTAETGTATAGRCPEHGTPTHEGICGRCEDGR